MRFRIRVARGQTVERVVNAMDEQAAIAKVESELQKPYGLLGSWTTVDAQVEVVEAEPVAGISLAGVGEGPMLLSVAAAGKHLGVSRGVLYEPSGLRALGIEIRAAIHIGECDQREEGRWQAWTRRRPLFGRVKRWSPAARSGHPDESRTMVLMR